MRLKMGKRSIVEFVLDATICEILLPNTRRDLPRQRCSFFKKYLVPERLFHIKSTTLIRT